MKYKSITTMDSMALFVKFLEFAVSHLWHELKCEVRVIFKFLENNFILDVILLKEIRQLR